MYCGTQTTNMEHPNAGTSLRLPNTGECHAAVQEVSDAFVLGEGQFEDLDEDANAIAASTSMTTALQQVTALGDRDALIVTYQTSLNIHVAELNQKKPHTNELFPLWAVHTVAGILSGTVCFGSFHFRLLVGLHVPTPPETSFEAAGSFGGDPGRRTNLHNFARLSHGSCLRRGFCRLRVPRAV